MTIDDLNNTILDFVKKAVIDNDDLGKKILNFLTDEMDYSSQQLDLTDWTYYFLQIQSGPKQMNQIIEEMRGNGVKLPSGNPATVISSKLRRDSRFTFTQKNGWEINKGIESNVAASNYKSGDISDEAARIIAEETYASLKGTQSIDELGKYVLADATGVPYNVDVELLRRFKTMYRRFARLEEKENLRDSIVKVFKEREQEREREI